MTGITVIVPVLNEVLLIRSTLWKLLKQKKYVKEIIVFDGGSTDGTIKKIKEVMQKHKGIKLMEFRGLNPGTELQLALEKVMTSHVLILGSDDSLESRTLPRCVAAIAENPNIPRILFPIRFYYPHQRKSIESICVKQLLTSLNHPSTALKFLIRNIDCDFFWYGLHKTELLLSSVRATKAHFCIERPYWWWSLSSILFSPLDIIYLEDDCGLIFNRKERGLRTGSGFNQLEFANKRRGFSTKSGFFFQFLFHKIRERLGSFINTITFYQIGVISFSGLATLLFCRRGFSGPTMTSAPAPMSFPRLVQFSKTLAE